MVFKDRVHAGKLLGDALVKYAGREDVIVLGLPRGGVPVAYEVARKLHVHLDVIIVRKLGVPGWEELAMGAIASGGVVVMNEKVVRNLSIPRDAIDDAIAEQSKELKRREMAYRGHAGVPEIKGKIVILVDDGMATGSTIRAAVQALRRRKARKIVAAVPVAAHDSCTMLKPEVDDLIVLLVPDDFQAVGQWYEDFTQTTDEEVTGLLARFRC